MEQIFTTILCPIFVPASVEVEVKLLRAAGKRLLADCLGGDELSSGPGMARRTWNDSDMAGKWDGIIMESPCHWIGLRENLQETMVFTKYRAFP